MRTLGSTRSQRRLTQGTSTAQPTLALPSINPSLYFPNTPIEYPHSKPTTHPHMIFTIAVHGAPYASQANHHALRFCSACVAKGHKIKRVFFYHEAVLTALSTHVYPQEEGNPTQDWRDFAHQNNVELAVCIANGLKRGVLSASESSRYEKQTATLEDGFELVGLGQLIEAIATSDRYVEFPA